MLTAPQRVGAPDNGTRNRIIVKALVGIELRFGWGLLTTGTCFCEQTLAYYRTNPD